MTSHQPSADFVRQIKVYLDTCSDLEAANKELKLLRDSKKQLEEEISSYMTENDFNQIETEGFKISLRNSKSRKALDEKTIAAELAKHMDRAAADNLAKTLYENRQITEKTTISRTIAKK